MDPKNLRIFLDTSVLFAAVHSPSGGARKLFLLAEARILRLVVGPTVLKECDEVIRRKAPGSLPTLAQLLAAAQMETSGAPTRSQIKTVQAHVRCRPDACVLAETINAKPDWFETNGKERFLRSHGKFNLPFEVGTPGDLIQTLLHLALADKDTQTQLDFGTI